MTDADEARLVEAAQRDPARFGELYERHVDRVYAFVARRTRDRDMAEDVTAEVFHKALAALPRYEWRGLPFGAWLTRIAANVLADRAARNAREVVGTAHLPEASEAASQDQFDDHAELARFVAELPPDQRTVVHERFIEQRSIREVAGRLNKTEGAVKQLQFRALQTLRARMEGEDA